MLSSHTAEAVYCFSGVHLCVCVYSKIEILLISSVGSREHIVQGQRHNPRGQDQGHDD